MRFPSPHLPTYVGAGAPRSVAQPSALRPTGSPHQRAECHSMTAESQWNVLEAVPSPLWGLKCFSGLRMSRWARGWVGSQGLLCPAQPESPAGPRATPPPVSIQKAKRKRSKELLEANAPPGGATPTPLQATPNWLLGEGGGTRAQRPPPGSDNIQRLLIFSSTLAAAFHMPHHPGQGRGCALSTY